MSKNWTLLIGEQYISIYSIEVSDSENPAYCVKVFGIGSIEDLTKGATFSEKFKKPLMSRCRCYSFIL